jgi:hypothetical protein
VRYHLNTGVGLAANYGPRPWLCRVEGYRHAKLTPVQVVDPGQSATVERNVAVVAEMEEYVLQHPQEPRSMLARGTQSPILDEVEVGVIVQLHLKCRHKNVTNPISKAPKTNIEICIKANSSK